MRRTKILSIVFLGGLGLGIAQAKTSEDAEVFPGRQRLNRTPEQVGLSAKKLKEFSDYAGGFGCVVRHGDHQALIEKLKVSVAGGDQSWAKPRGIGSESAVHIRRIGK